MRVTPRVLMKIVGAGIAFIGCLFLGLFLGTGLHGVTAGVLLIVGALLFFGGSLKSLESGLEETPENISSLESFVKWARKECGLHDVSSEALQTLYLTDSVTFKKGSVVHCYILSVDDFTGERHILELTSPDALPEVNNSMSLSHVTKKAKSAVVSSFVNPEVLFMKEKQPGTVDIVELERIEKGEAAQFLGGKVSETFEPVGASKVATLDTVLLEKTEGTDFVDIHEENAENLIDEALDNNLNENVTVEPIRRVQASTKRKSSAKPKKRGRKPLTVTDLRLQAKALGVKNYSGMKKEELKKAIRTAKRHLKG